MKIFFALSLGYLIGAIPFSFIIAKLLKGIDLRKEGTKNVGATNVAILLGKKAGFFALLLDILKGVIAVILAEKIFHSPKIVATLVGFSAILGHNWPIFLNFKGGKGVATGMGVMGVLFPQEAIVLFFLLLFVFFLIDSPIFSLTLVSLFVPLILWIFKEPLMLINLTALMVIFIQIRGFSETKERYKEIKRRQPERGWIFLKIIKLGRS